MNVPLNRRRTNSCCSCLCHYCNERSSSLSTIDIIMPSVSLMKSLSCPSLLLYTSECPSHQVMKGYKISLSSSLETLFSSVSTRDCVCHNGDLGKLFLFIRFNQFVFFVIFKVNKQYYVMNVPHHHLHHVFVVQVHGLIWVIHQVN